MEDRRHERNDAYGSEEERRTHGGEAESESSTAAIPGTYRCRMGLRFVKFLMCRGSH